MCFPNHVSFRESLRTSTPPAGAQRASDSDSAYARLCAHAPNANGFCEIQSWSEQRMARLLPGGAGDLNNRAESE